MARLYPQGDTHPARLLRLQKPINSALEGKPRKPFTFTTAVVLAGSFVEEPTDDGWKGLSRRGFRAAAAAALQWQAGMEPSFLPSFSPLCSHTLGCRHRRCDSDRFAWKKPFRLLGGGGREEESGERGCGEAPHRSCSSSSSSSESAGSKAPFQRDRTGGPGGVTPEALELLCPPFTAEWMRLPGSLAPPITLGRYNTSRLLYDCYKQQHHNHSQPPIKRNIAVQVDFHLI